MLEIPKAIPAQFCKSIPKKAFPPNPKNSASAAPNALPSWLGSNEFMKKALIPKYVSDWVPKLVDSKDYNDDLILGSFEKNKRIWAGLQKKGVSPEIIGALSYEDHIAKATGTLFPLTMDTPLPGEINESLEFLKSTDPKLVLSFWEIQLERLLRLVEDCSTTQSEWSDHIPERIKGAQTKFKSVAFHQLLRNFSLGGGINGLLSLYLASRQRDVFLRTAFSLSRTNTKPRLQFQ